MMSSYRGQRGFRGAGAGAGAFRGRGRARGGWSFNGNDKNSWERERRESRENRVDSFDTGMSSEKKSETAKLDATLKRLQKEVDELEKEKASQLTRDPKSEELFERWGGIAIDDANDRECRVTFTSLNEHNETYQIGFKKVAAYWKASFFNLPPCMTLITKRVEELKIDSVESLSLLVHDLQMEVAMFNRRAKQFKEALTLSSSTLEIYPAVSTTSAMLELAVNDSVESGLSRVSVYLKYHVEKYLPEEPIFKFQGGDETARLEFKNQLACLQYMPLKEALVSAFSLDGQGEEQEGKQTCKDEDKPEILKDTKAPLHTETPTARKIKKHKPEPKRKARS